MQVVWKNYTLTLLIWRQSGKTKFFLKNLALSFHPSLWWQTFNAKIRKILLEQFSGKVDDPADTLNFSVIFYLCVQWLFLFVIGENLFGFGRTTLDNLHVRCGAYICLWVMHRTFVRCTGYVIAKGSTIEFLFIGLWPIRLKPLPP